MGAQAPGYYGLEVFGPATVNLDGDGLSLLHCSGAEQAVCAVDASAGRADDLLGLGFSAEGYDAERAVFTCPGCFSLWECVD